MSEVTLYGVAGSNYVRSCRMALEEKGVAYELVESTPRDDDQKARHPFGKIPSLTHGEVNVFESFAICRYVDEAFDGLGLQPADPAGRAHMTQWVSVFIDYVYDMTMRAIVIQRVIVPRYGGETDEAIVKDGAERFQGPLKVIEAHLGANAYFAGDDMTIADLFFAPCLDYFRLMPEGAVLADHPNTTAWLEKMCARDSAKAAGVGVPPQG